ncbi:MAG: HmuY family protein [Nitrospinae bacterium]|nr:HmuY family protein [Nitrospinota bacterium]
MSTTDPFESSIPATEPAPVDGGSLKKKKLWRNLFALNLCLTLLLIALFWLPFKLLQLENFINLPSVNLPKTGEAVKNPVVPVVQEIPENILPPRTVMINASSENDWVYFDFSRDGVVKIHDPSSLEWDLAFRRTKVITNGGATNKFGKAGLIDLGAVGFNYVTEAPLDSYVKDTATRTETENQVLLKWYRYNYFTHKLTAKPNIYAVQTADSKFAKVKFLNFYCTNKETGCIRMQYVYQENGSNQFLKPATS